MSKGLGKIERAILDALEKQAANLSSTDSAAGVERHVPLTNSRDLLFRIHGGFEGLRQGGNLRAKYNAMTRALRSLERKGLVQSTKYDGRTIWTDARGAALLDELYDAINPDRPG